MHSYKFCLTFSSCRSKKNFQQVFPLCVSKSHLCRANSLKCWTIWSFVNHLYGCPRISVLISDMGGVLWMEVGHFFSFAKSTPSWVIEISEDFFNSQLNVAVYFSGILSQPTPINRNRGRIYSYGTHFSNSLFVNFYVLL